MYGKFTSISKSGWMSAKMATSMRHVVSISCFNVLASLILSQLPHQHVRPLMSIMKNPDIKECLCSTREFDDAGCPSVRLSRVHWR